MANPEWTEPSDWGGETSPDTVAAPICTDSEAVDLDRIRHSMALLQANAEACVANHHRDDFALFGMPRWLADTRADLEALTRIRTLSAQASATLGGATDWRGLCEKWLAAVDTGRNEPLQIMRDLTRNAIKDAALSLQNATPDAGGEA